MKRMTAAALFSILASLFATANAFVDQCDGTYEKYTPNTIVERWQQNEFEASVEYGKRIGFQRALPLAAVAVVLIVIIMVWWCCRACGNCRMRKQGRCCHSILLVSTCCLIIASIALLVVGFAVDSEQSSAMKSVPEFIENIESYTDDIAIVVNRSADTVVELSNDILDIFNTPDYDQIFDDQNLTDLEDRIEETQMFANDLRNDVGGVSLGQFSEKFGDEVENYDQQRSNYMRILLGVLMAFVILFGLIALLDAYGPESLKFRNKPCCSVCTIPLRMLMLLLALVLWILAALLLALLTAGSDFCIQADNNLFDLTTDGASGTSIDYLRFIIYCDSNSTACDASPFNDLYTPVDSTFNIAVDALRDVESLYNSSCVPPPSGLAATCADIETILNDFETSFQNFRDDVDDALETLVSCSAVNRRYQLLVNAACGDVMYALGRTFEVVLGFAVIFLMTIVVTSMLADYDQAHGEGSDGEKDVELSTVK